MRYSGDHSFADDRPTPSFQAPLSRTPPKRKFSCRLDSICMPSSVFRTLRLKVRRESYGWLVAAASEVNEVFNYCNEISSHTANRTDLRRKWLTGFDLCSLTAGATDYFGHIGAATINRICLEHAQKRAAVRRCRLRWRISGGPRRSLGWVPFKGSCLKRKGRAVRFCGKSFRVFQADRLDGVKWKQGCFAQDAVGDWWLCVSVERQVDVVGPSEGTVGIDLGLKDVAVTSEGERLACGRFYRGLELRIAEAQRRGHRRQAKRLHRKAARRRADAFHKFTRRIVDRYEFIVVGDVSSRKLIKTPMAKSVLDSGWGILKRMLQYKGEYAGRSVTIVSERNDVNAARNIRFAGLRSRASVCGNESLHEGIPIEPDRPVLARYGWGACYIST